MMADDSPPTNEQSDPLIIGPELQDYIENIIDSSATPARSLQRFWYELEHFLNGRDLDESVAVLCAVLLRAIKEAEAIGGPKAEQSKRAIVAFKKAAALLVETPELQLALASSKMQKSKGRKSGAHNPKLETAMREAAEQDRLTDKVLKWWHRIKYVTSKGGNDDEEVWIKSVLRKLSRSLRRQKKTTQC